MDKDNEQDIRQPQGDEVEVVDGNIGAGIFCLVSVVAIILIGLFFFFSDESKVETALREYREAVTFCGENNVLQHRYSNGSTDFDCESYSKVK
ncbi:hypothetical protein KW797_04710 [Candidatus Parcubacteria bacterium]|nr:hypothetical protein [Candidatus Parcubacteria bacterium]